MKEKNLIPSETVLERWQAITANVRARLLSIPSNLAATCADQPKETVEEKASELIRQALNELAADVEY